MMNFLNSCNTTKQDDCFVRLIESHLLSGNQTEIKKIKANNIDACQNCSKYRYLQKCKATLKQRDKIKKNLKKRYK